MPRRAFGPQGGKTNSPSIDAGTSIRNRSYTKTATGKQTGNGRSLAQLPGDLDLRDPEQLYHAAQRLECKVQPAQLVAILEAADVRAQTSRTDQSLEPEIPRDPYLGSVPAAIPYTDYTVALGRGVSELVRQAMAASEAFLRGLRTGLQQSLSKEDYQKLSGKLQGAALLNAVFPFVFAAGASVGLLEGLWEQVKGVIELAQHWKEIASEVAKLLKEVLEHPKLAEALGKQYGTHLAKQIKAAGDQNQIRFTYELGKLVGPTIIWIVLSFFLEISLVGLGLKVAKDIIEALREYPAVAAILRRIEGLVTAPLVPLLGKAFAESGMTQKHFNIFIKIAREENVIILVRTTNKECRRWIELGFPAKPKIFNNLSKPVKTSKKTGIVTAIEEQFEEIRKLDYYVVDADLVARNAQGKPLALGKTEWTLEKGQVIDPVKKKPLVGDYDLMGVFDPDPAAPGRAKYHLAVVPDDPATGDWTNPHIKKLIERFKAEMGEERVMHGAHDQAMGGTDPGDVIAFHPNGKAVYFPKDSPLLTWFYEGMGRKMITKPKVGK